MPTRITGLVIAAFLLLCVAVSLLNLAGYTPGDLPGWSALLMSLIVSLFLLLRVIDLEKEIHQLKAKTPDRPAPPR